MNNLTVGQLIEELSQYDKNLYINIDSFMDFRDGKTVCGYNTNLSLEDSFYIDDEFVDDSNTLYIQINVKAIESEIENKIENKIENNNCDLPEKRNNNCIDLLSYKRRGK